MSLVIPAVKASVHKLDSYIQTTLDKGCNTGHYQPKTQRHIHAFLKQAANMSSYIKEFFVMYLPPSILAQANHQTSPVVLVWTGFMCFD